MTRSIYKRASAISTIEMCEYGCGNIAAYVSQGGKKMCASSSNKCQALRDKNSLGVTKAHKDGKIPGWTELNNRGLSNRGWSKGLTKEVDARVGRPGLIGKRFGASLTGHTQETKDRMSQHRVCVLENSPHVKWMALSNGIKVQGTWEFNVGEKLLSDNILVSRTRLQFDQHRRYTPDFCIGENTYVEVKGWLSDRDIKKYKKVLIEHPNIKIILIRDEGKRHNYSNFISGKITLDDCEDLREVILGC